MRNCICLVLLVSTAGSVYGNASAKVGKFDLLRGAVSRMLGTTEFVSKMSWRRGGVAIDMFVLHMKEHETAVYNLYTEARLRNQLGRALKKELQGNVFKMKVDVSGTERVTKYFIGKEPDLEAILAEILSFPEIDDKLELANGGLTMDEIITMIAMFHKDVYPLYIGASAGKTDHGLRVSLGYKLEKLLQGNVFSIPIDIGGKLVHKYFRGKAPDLKAIISEIIAIPELRAKMKLPNEGLSIDDIIEEIIIRYPDVYLLYLSAAGGDSDRGLRIAIGTLLDKKMQGEVFSIRVRINGKLVSKYFLTVEYDLKEILLAVIALPEVKAKFNWKNGGATMNDIIEGVIKLYPDVHSMYVNASHNWSDNGLRAALATLLFKLPRRKFFSMAIGANYQRVTKYFRGTAPDLQQIAAEIVALPAISSKMATENGGVSIDTMITVVADHYPDVYTLYTQLSNHGNERGLRTSLGKALASVNGVVVRKSRAIGTRYFWDR